MKYYHYTDIYPFESIIRNQEFWAFHFAYMNDRNEYHWVISLAEDYIEEIQRRDNSTLSIYFADIVRSTSSRQSLVFPFLVALSKKKDDLNQWRAYGRDGSGVCLEIELEDSLRIIPTSEIIEEWQKTFEFKSIVPYFGWHQISIEYIDGRKSNLLEKYIVETYEWMKQRYGADPKYDTNFKNDLEMISYYLWVISLGLKDSAFKEEDEHRLFMVAPIRMDTLEYEEQFLKNQLHYIATQQGLKSYVKFPFGTSVKLTGVMAGPKYSGNLWDLNDLLRKYNFENVVVNQSRIPYR